MSKQKQIKTKMKFDVILFWVSFYLMYPYYSAIMKAKSMLNKNGIIVIGDDYKRVQDRTEKPKKYYYSLKELSIQSGLQEIKNFLIKKVARKTDEK